MGGERIKKEWLNFFGEGGGLLATVPSKTLKKYGRRKLEIITGFLDTRGVKARWVAHSVEHIILIKYSDFGLYVSRGESEYEAMYSNKAESVATFSGPGSPSTQEVIDFFRFSVKEEQILEFFS